MGAGDGCLIRFAPLPAAGVGQSGAAGAVFLSREAKTEHSDQESRHDEQIGHALSVAIPQNRVYGQRARMTGVAKRFIYTTK